MARYIDADKLYPDILTDKGLAISQSQIANAKTEKVQPIVRGKWNQLVDYDENDNGLFECSNCKKTDTHAKSVKVPYCWNCGAKMEELECKSGGKNK